ncbi:hypothetical protein E2C01_040189 [Portunus trituberculatus]|uniref:Uncharacterized protein n=1 Tax=Portunus trituberculatus TaxID=210409 RepID=A0A5B7FMN1_PORTR|nr:hypothetical protein [Portunus trituberculatus]
MLVIILLIISLSMNGNATLILVNILYANPTNLLM